MEWEFRYRKPDAGGTGLNETKLIYFNQTVQMEFSLLKTTIPTKCPVVFLCNACLTATAGVDFGARLPCHSTRREKRRIVVVDFGSASIQHVAV